MTRTAAKLLLLLVLGLLVTGPAHALGDRARRAYLRAHRAVTEQLVIYKGFETALLMRATLIDPLFLDALSRERARLLGPALDDPERLIQEMELDREGIFEVVFAADSGMPFGKDFAPDEKGWTLRMEADGEEQPLIRVEHIRRPSPMQRALFPQITIWAELYVARFERTVASPSFIELHVGSGYGHDTLRWERTTRRARKLERAFRSMQREE